MTDESREIGGTPGPPWSVDVLADLHAGVLDGPEAERLWSAVDTDPDARAILDALDATQADLATFATAPAPRMPPEVAARLDAALAAEAAAAFPHAGLTGTPTPPVARPDTSQQNSARPNAGSPSASPDAVRSATGSPAAGSPATNPPSTAPPAAAFPGAGGAPPSGESGSAPVLDLAAARRRRNKRLGWTAGVLTAAAAAIVGVVVALPGATQQTGTPGVAAPPSGPTVGRDGSGAEALVGKAVGVRDFGPLQNETRLNACVAAAGLDPKVRPEGIRPVNVDGKAGVMILLTTGKLAQFRLVAFGADCGAGNPDVLFDKVVGEK